MWPLCRIVDRSLAWNALLHARMHAPLLVVWSARPTAGAAGVGICSGARQAVWLHLPSAAAPISSPEVAAADITRSSGLYAGHSQTLPYCAAVWVVQVAAVLGLSVLELCMLVAAQRLEDAGSAAFNFQVWSTEHVHAVHVMHTLLGFCTCSC